MPWNRCRSEPQIAARVTRTIASLGCSMRGRSFSSTRTRYGPRYTMARMSLPSFLDRVPPPRLQGSRRPSAAGYPEAGAVTPDGTRSVRRGLRKLHPYAARYDARVAAVTARDRGDDGQPEAVARDGPCPVRAREPVEGVAVKVGRDAGTLVDDLDPYRPVDH